MAESERMGTLGLKIDDELDAKFRDAVYKRKGMKKGNITDALEEAIKMWIDSEKKEKKQ
jgi:hypothetical protein